MKTPSVLLLAGTLLVAGSVALLARVLLTPPAAPKIVEVITPPAPVAKYPAILVANRDLQPGDFIDASAVRWQDSDSAHDARLFFIEGDEESEHLTGASVRQPVKSGEALTSNLLVKANEPGFIATVIKPGMRAIAVPTNNSASLYSMINLGDRVDVLVNLQREQESALINSSNGEQIPRLAAQTLLENVRVLSINNRLRSPLQPRNEDESTRQKKKTDPYPASKPEVVTLEVPPAYAERLALASQIGILQLVLRSSLDAGDGEVRQGSGQVTTLAQTTSVYRDSASSTAAKIHTIHGDTASAVQFNPK
jgi:pilus assembly protein CpaB